MPTFRVDSLREFKNLYNKHTKARIKRIKVAVVKTLKDCKRYVITTTLPIAFRELDKSLLIRQNQVNVPGVGATQHFSIGLAATAPHAEVVENGARPHYPPLEPILNWVKLRASQGKLTPKKFGALRGTTTKAHARNIAMTLHVMALMRKQATRTALRKAGFSKPALRAAMKQVQLYNTEDDYIKIAKAIQTSIGKNGTPPHKYMEKTVPYALVKLKLYVDMAVPD